MKARRWAMAAAAAFLLAPALAWPQSDALLDDYNRYATLYAQERFQEALPFALRVVEAHKSEFGPNHPTAAVLLANVAELYVELGRLAQAEPLFVKAVRIAERSLGQGHRTTAVLVGKLAKLYRRQGRYDDAEILYLRTIKITEKEFGPKHMAVAVSLNDLAQLYYLEGRFAEAEPLYRRALGILAEIERVHPLTSAVLFNNVAELFAAQGRTFGAVMPRLASRLNADDAAADSVADSVADSAAEGPEGREAGQARAASREESREEPIVAAAVEDRANAAAPEAEEVEVALAEPAGQEESREVPMVAAAVEDRANAVPPEAEEVEIAAIEPSEAVRTSDAGLVRGEIPTVELVEKPSEAAAVETGEIAEPAMEQAALPDLSGSVPERPEAPETPIVEEAVAALESAPARAELPAPETDRAGDDGKSETSPESEAELEWARIDAALNIPAERAASAPAAPPEEESAEMHFDLAGVIIDGSSIYTASELLPIYRRYLGQDVSVTDLYKISRAITTRYASDGYAGTTAVVPTQLIRGGVVTIRIREGFVGNVIVVD